MSNPKFCSRMILVADKYYGTKLETPETSRIYVRIGANDNGHFFTLISPSFGDVEGEKYCFINNDMYRNKTKTVFFPALKKENNFNKFSTSFIPLLIFFQISK